MHFHLIFNLCINFKLCLIFKTCKSRALRNITEKATDHISNPHKGPEAQLSLQEPMPVWDCVGFFLGNSEVQQTLPGLS